MKKIFDFLAWPVAFGLMAALAFLLFSPSVRPLLNAQSAGASYGQNARHSYAEAVSRAAPAVVNIFTQRKVPKQRHPLIDDPLFRHFFNNANVPQQERLQSSLGSGVIMNPDGYVLTNHHVINGADQIVVLLNDGREAQARVIGTDPDTDLAVLKINLDNLHAIALGDPSAARVGDVVLAIGNPFGVGQTVTQGIISAVGRYGLGINTFENYLQTDAAINPGNSGGALVDADGNLIGINTAILDKTGFSVGISFAVPIDMALRTLKDIAEHGHVVRGWIGVEAQAVSPQLARNLGVSADIGVIVTGVYKDSPAHQVGIRAGDIITHLNGIALGDGRKGVQFIEQSRPGDSITLRIQRGLQVAEVQLTMAAQPSN
ncbi:trypsin-like peptidase domain-containing protein [Simiduia aestuariiviva]|uniref:Serine protease DegS n=1 Tax=Simiduia aestuariiviva TaxID=1510459 RepID=A0A839ULS9_9GAMM|nr:serine protease DegS [Simiduia aestuariiviva]